MPQTACTQLGSGTDHIDRHNDEGLKLFVSCEAIYDSIKTSKLSKAPGIDGFPIEFYDALARNKHSTIVKMLQKSIYSCLQDRRTPPFNEESSN